MCLREDIIPSRKPGKCLSRQPVRLGKTDHLLYAGKIQRSTQRGNYVVEFPWDEDCFAYPEYLVKLNDILESQLHLSFDASTPSPFVMRLMPGDTVDVVEKHTVASQLTFLRLSDNRGWIPSWIPGRSIVCKRKGLFMGYSCMMLSLAPGSRKVDPYSHIVATISSAVDESDLLLARRANYVF